METSFLTVPIRRQFVRRLLRSFVFQTEDEENNVPHFLYATHVWRKFYSFRNILIIKAN